MYIRMGEICIHMHWAAHMQLKLSIMYQHTPELVK